MRSQSSGRRSVRGVHVALVAAMLAIATPTIGATHVATAATPTPWEATGPETVTLASDGSVTPPQMSYNLVDDPAGARFSDKSWTLQTTADSDIEETVPYTLLAASTPTSRFGCTSTHS